MRYDLQLIASWIAPESRVLDLGCGNGELLEYLKHHKKVQGVGIEKDEKKVAACIEKGLWVLQGDINGEVTDYPDNAFDYVILSQTLQQVYHPRELIAAILRIGCCGIVSFPNFSHWGIRLQLLLSGYAPVSRQLPWQWYDTPNIRVITLKDFRRFIRRENLQILREAAINTQAEDRHGRIMRILPDLLATYGVFMIGRNGCHCKSLQ